MNGGTTAHTLFLDFDGVVADSLEESLLVSWYGAGRGSWSRGDAPRELATRVPDDYRARFRQIRSYARTLDEFIVPALKDVGTPESQTEFAELFDAVTEFERAEFVRRAQEFRDYLRSEHLDAWGAMHELYREVPQLIHRFAGRVHIVTAKDDVSARVALGLAGLEAAVASVTGGASDKPIVIRAVLAAIGRSADGAFFVDDNITNVAAAQAAGIRSRWATWGWQQTPEHHDEARRRGLASITLADLGEVRAVV